MSERLTLISRLLRVQLKTSM